MNFKERISLYWGKYLILDNSSLFICQKDLPLQKLYCDFVLKVRTLMYFQVPVVFT